MAYCCKGFRKGFRKGCCCIPGIVVLGADYSCWVVGCNYMVVGYNFEADCNCFEVAPDCIHCLLADSGC